MISEELGSLGMRCQLRFCLLEVYKWDFVKTGFSILLYKQT